MKRKQNLKKTRPARGEARTEYGEQKKPCNLSLTQTAIATLDRIATHLKISRSELVERIARGDAEAIVLLTILTD